MRESFGNILLIAVLIPIALTFLGAAMVMCNGGAGSGFYGSDNPSLWRHIKMFFLVGAVSAILFGLIGGLGWGFWKILQFFDFAKEWSVPIAALLSVPIVTIGWYHGTGVYWKWREKAKSDNDNEDSWRLRE